MMLLEIPKLLMSVAVCFSQMSRCEKSWRGRAEGHVPSNTHNTPSNNTLKGTGQHLKNLPHIFRTQTGRKEQISDNDEQPTFSSRGVNTSVGESDQVGTVVMATSKTDADNPMPINRNSSGDDYNSTKIFRSVTVSGTVVFAERYSSEANSKLEAQIQPSEVWRSLYSESVLEDHFISKPVLVHDRKVLLPSSEYAHSNFDNTMTVTTDFKAISVRNSQALQYLSRDSVIEPSTSPSLSPTRLKSRAFSSISPSTTLNLALKDSSSKYKILDKASMLHDILQPSSQAQHSSTKIPEHISSPPKDITATYRNEHSRVFNSIVPTSVYPSAKVEEFAESFLTWDEHSMKSPKSLPQHMASEPWIRGRVFPKQPMTLVMRTPTTSPIIPKLISIPIMPSRGMNTETPVNGTFTSKVTSLLSTIVDIRISPSIYVTLSDTTFSSLTIEATSASSKVKPSATQEVFQLSPSQQQPSSRASRIAATSKAMAATTVTSSNGEIVGRNVSSLSSDISITATSHAISFVKIDLTTALLSYLSVSGTPDLNTINYTATTVGLPKGETTTTGSNEQIPKTPPKNLPEEFEKTTPSPSQHLKTTRVPMTVPDGFPKVYLIVALKIPWSSFCGRYKEFQQIIAKLAERSVQERALVRPQQIRIANTYDCDNRDRSVRLFIRIQERNTLLQPVHEPWHKTRRRSRREPTVTDVYLYVVDSEDNFDVELTTGVFQELNSSVNPLQDSTFSEKVLSVSLVDNRPATTKQEVVAKATRATPLNPGVIAAVVVVPVVVLCLLAFVIVRIILSRRRGKAMRSYFTGSREPSFDSRSTNDFALATFSGFRRSKRGRKSNKSIGFVNTALQTEEGLPSNPVNRTGLSRLCYDTDLLGEEFKLIPNLPSRLADLPQGCEDKNRFANVIPNSKTRVMLPLLPGRPQSQYINANNVRGYMGERSYIATQAPLDNTIYDFWRMVWENHSQVIVMLTELHECDLPKCSPYWPSSEGADTVQQYENLEISLKKREVKKDYIMSKLRLKDTETKQWRDLVHFWFLGWPHHGVPESPLALLTFLDEVRPYMAISNGPTIVHCSPGTGRTGAFLAMHICMEQYDDSESVDVLSCVHRLRQDRAGLLQTKDQYTFIYTTLNEYATCLHGPSHDDSSGSGSDDDVS